ncbi:MAG: hypothetical protein IKF72_10585 [Kiritimatiellae bacterium]|nr:hypothetical protein [Kiritimatiellia bacterium]
MMTRRMLIAILVAVGIAGAFGGPVANPGFEEPASDGAVPGWEWRRDDSVATVSVVPGEGVGGSQALLIDKRSPDKEFVVRQRIRLAPGGHYRVTCRVRTEDFICRNVDLTGTKLAVLHIIGGKPVSLPAQSTRTVTETSGGWARAVGHIDPPADSEGEVELRLWIHFSVTGKFYYDDITVEERVDPPVPEPSRADASIVDKDNRLIVDGKPYLPLGFYSEAWDPFTVSNLDLIASGPYNTIVPYSFPDRSQMDMCAARGLKVLYNANVYYGTRWAFGKVKSEEEEESWTARTIAEFKDHPALLGWYVNDEFNIAFRDRLVARNRLVKSLDPRHVTWGVHMEPLDSRWFLACHDVLGVDPYPIKGNGKEMKLMRCHEHPSVTLQTVANMRAVWQVIQVFDWGMFSTELLKKGSRPPTREEISAMTQLAIAGGANGIFYLSTTSLASPVNGANFYRRWADVLAAANEVKANEATILSPSGPAVADASPESLKVRTWDTGERMMALVVNGSYQPVAGTVSCAGCEPLEVNLGALAHGYYVLQKKNN